MRAQPVFRRKFHRVVATAVFGSAAVCATAQYNRPSGTWDFDLKESGSYSLEIEHDLQDTAAAGNLQATYTITLGYETQSREHAVILNRPFVPMSVNLHSPTHLHVLITGIPDALLRDTRVWVMDGQAHEIAAASAPTGTTCAHCGTSVAADLMPPAIRKQLALSEDQIDLGLAALTFAKEIYPEIDIDAYSHKIDVLADEVRQLAGPTTDPERRIRALNTVLFRNEGYHYDRDAFSRSVQRYYFLNGILDSRQGICYTLPLLYMAVAQRLGYPIYPVAAPDHLFLRYVDPAFDRQNIEATSGGKYFPDASYVEHFSVSAQGMTSGSYMRTLTYREFLGHLLAANALVYAREGRIEKALQYSGEAVKLNPRFADHYDALRVGYEAERQALKGPPAERARREMKYYAAKASELGFVDPATIAIAREDVRGAQ
jgi:regulator of sirC expression with transglutaminase-like and TPR domain